jgi:hypothetical protein
MPFGMGPAGWFLMPYFASYWGQWYPWGGGYPYPQSWGAPGYPYPEPSGAPPPTEELQSLTGQAEMLEGQLEWVRARIAELEKAEQQKA